MNDAPIDQRSCRPFSPWRGKRASPRQRPSSACRNPPSATRSAGLKPASGLRLLTRTTRSVSPTEAGERLLTSIGPRFDEIESELAALSEFREKPAGTIRINAGEHAADAILWPALEAAACTIPTSTSRSSSTTG